EELPAVRSQPVLEPLDWPGFADVSLGGLLLLCAAAFAAGTIDAIVGGGGLLQLPALLLIMPGGGAICSDPWEGRCSPTRCPRKRSTRSSWSRSPRWGSTPGAGRSWVCDRGRGSAVLRSSRCCWPVVR